MNKAWLVTALVAGFVSSAFAQEFDPILKSSESLGSVWTWEWHHGRQTKDPAACEGLGDGTLVIFNNKNIAFKGRYKNSEKDTTYTDIAEKGGTWEYVGAGTGDEAGVRWYHLKWGGSTDTVRLSPIGHLAGSNNEGCDVAGDRQAADVPAWSQKKK